MLKGLKEAAAKSVKDAIPIREQVALYQRRAEETQEAQAANVKHYVRPRMCQLLALPMMFRLCVPLCMAEVCLCPRYFWTSCNLTLRLQAPGFGFLAKMHRK